MVETIMEAQRRWSRAASRAKKEIDRWRKLSLGLTISGALLVTAASQAKALGSGVVLSLSILGSLAVAAAPIVSSEGLGGTSISDWARLRSVSEGLKSEAYLYLTHTPPYHQEDREQQLIGELERITVDAADLASRAEGVEAGEITVPAVHDAETYGHGATNRSSSKKASILASSAGSRLASSGSTNSQIVVCGSLSRSTSDLPRTRRQEITTVSFNHEPDPSTDVSAAQPLSQPRLLQEQVVLSRVCDPEGGAPHPHADIGLDERDRVRHVHDEQDRQRQEESVIASEVEMAKRDRPVLIPLLQQQRRDQEAAQREEDVYADERSPSAS
jgi:hypothetical protein